MKLSFTFLAALLLASNILYSQELISPKFGKGIFNLVGQDSSWTMKVGARFQFLASSLIQNEENPESSFLIRRARLKFDGYAVSPKLEYKIELGLSNRDVSGVSVFTGNTPRYVMDAVLKYNFYQNFTLWVGQTKLPGNRERVISSANMQQVDRSILNARFNIDRDIGFQLRHHFTIFDHFVVEEIFALSQGEGRNVVTGNLGGHQYTGRIELLPMGNFTGSGDYSGSDLKREETPKLAVGISYDHNNNAVRTRSNQGSYMEIDNGFYETNINTWFVDTMFKYKGFSLMAEYADRDAKDPIAKNSDGTSTGDIVQIGKGINIQSGYLFKNNWEVSGRYSSVELNEDITGTAPEHQYTFGVSKFIVGHSLKIQSDVSLIDIINQEDQILFRLQFDIHF
jgi:phosphate-selective porin OprO/OprP